MTESTVRRAFGAHGGADLSAPMTRRARRAPWPFALVLLWTALGGCDTLRDLGFGGQDDAASDRATEAPPSETMPAAADVPGIAYRASLVGDLESDVRRLLEDTSQLVALQDRPPPTIAALRRRARDDVERFQAALRSEGFYAAKLDVAIDESAQPIEVRVEVASGARYTLAGYEVRYADADPPAAEGRPALEDLGLALGMAARAPEIVAAERALIAALGRRGYPFARVEERKTVVHHESATMTVTLDVLAGPVARFGAARFEGVERVEEDYLHGLLTWSEGDPYDGGLLESDREALAATGLFSAVRIVPGEALDPDGRLPISVRLAERSPRSIGFGFNFSTSEGFGGEAFWEHRNLFARNERLRLTLTASELEQSLQADLRKPAFLRRDQALLASAELANRNTDAFDEQSLSGFLGLERPVFSDWRARAGVSAEYSRLKDDRGERTFQLLGLPLSALRDSTDDPLDPVSGTRQGFELTPYFGTGDETLAFLKATASSTAYYALDSGNRFVLAGRGRLGALYGAATDKLPANKRFYAGGGGSIRGYEFQSVGPLDVDAEPLGGRSLVELSAELRIRLSDSFGVVPFVDGGTVFNSAVPDFSEELRWAAGLGLRYFTDFGPVRLDVAVPLNKRDNVDDDFQFYISLGQAF